MEAWQALPGFHKLRFKDQEVYLQGFEFRIAIKKENKSWVCLEKFHSGAPVVHKLHNDDTRKVMGGKHGSAWWFLERIFQKNPE